MVIMGIFGNAVFDILTVGTYDAREAITTADGNASSPVSVTTGAIGVKGSYATIKTSAIIYNLIIITFDNPSVVTAGTFYKIDLAYGVGNTQFQADILYRPNEGAGTSHSVTLVIKVPQIPVGGIKARASHSSVAGATLDVSLNGVGP